MPGKKSDVVELRVVPTGTLKRLAVDEVVPSRNNPRLLFDPEPLKVLRDSIREKGVLVPITVYPLKGQDKYGILDGERRYHCCADLKAEGLELEVPANVVDPPSRVAGLLYMVSIHQYLQQWELMPTALSLETVMNELNVRDSLRNSRKLTGLSEAQIERCKKLTPIPKTLSKTCLLIPTRKPASLLTSGSSFSPVLDLVSQVLPDIYQQLTRDGLTQKFVDK